VVTYDPNGGYGHPDHIHAHNVTAAAVAAAGMGAGTPDYSDYPVYPGEPWTVPKFYWTVLATSAFEAAIGALNGDDLRPTWQLLSLGELEFGYPDQDIDAVVEATPEACAAKAAALAAHTTQLTVGPTGRACALSNNMALPILGQEHYVLVAGAPGDRDERGWETDLLAGLGLDATGR
jgi:N-acetyl-1-D-myo-inositol-2-amino-2-deoxy-alpha-D-glucopyranoside deacetylase